MKAKLQFASQVLIYSSGLADRSHSDHHRSIWSLIIAWGTAAQIFCLHVEVCIRVNLFMSSVFNDHSDPLQQSSKLHGIGQICMLPPSSYNAALTELSTVSLLVSSLCAQYCHELFNRDSQYCLTQTAKKKKDRFAFHFTKINMEQHAKTQITVLSNKLYNNDTNCFLAKIPYRFSVQCFVCFFFCFYSVQDKQKYLFLLCKSEILNIIF